MLDNTKFPTISIKDNVFLIGVFMEVHIKEAVWA